MIFNFGHSSMACVFGVDVYGDHSDKWWHKLTIQPIYAVGSRVRDAIRWVRYRVDPNHRYHLIHTRLSPGYYDIDTLMLNGMFSLLRRYVEEEHEGVEALEKWGHELTDEEDHFLKDANQRQANKELEAVALYRWWVDELPAMKRRQSELMGSLYGGGRSFFVDAGDGLVEWKMKPFTESEKALHIELRGLEERIERDETEMLHRLVDIRGGLWT